MNIIQPGLYSFNAVIKCNFLSFLFHFVFLNRGRGPQNWIHPGPTKVIMQPQVTSPLKTKITRDRLLSRLVEWTKMGTVSFRAWLNVPTSCSLEFLKCSSRQGMRHHGKTPDWIWKATEGGFDSGMFPRTKQEGLHKQFHNGVQPLEKAKPGLCLCLHSG